MKKLNIMNKKLFISFLAALVLTLVSFFIYSLVTGKITFGAVEDGWDGVSVATSFSVGNGTVDNPYIIKTPDEFMYFKQLIEGEHYESYQDKYYELGNDIDLGSKSTSGIGVIVDEQERLFKGYFNGAGYTIKNVMIDNPVKINEADYYGLFTKTIDAHVKNINIDNYKIIADEKSEKVVIGSLIGDCYVSKLEDEDKDDSKEVEDLSEISNISFRNINIDISKVTSKDNYISTLINDISPRVLVNNIYLEGNIDGNKLENKISVVRNNLGKINNIISDINTKDITDVNYKDTKINNNYNVKNNKVYLEDEEISFEDILNEFNTDMEKDLLWEYNDNKFIITIIKKEIEEDEELDIPVTSKEFSFSVQPQAVSIELHDTGIANNNVYLNDLDSDYNHYMGLNYTGVEGSSIPTGENLGTYSDSNLAKVYIHYDSRDYRDSSIKGNVSVSEKYADIYYYKYYPIVNGKVTFDLIDNPWADRPDAKAFNGWVTEYEGAEISLDMEKYTRSVSIPASSFIQIEFKTNWTEATTVRSTSFSNLKSQGMVEYESSYETIYEDVSGYYLRGTVSRYYSYPSGALDSSGSNVGGTTCYSRTCTYYYLNTNPNYVSGTTYYEFFGNFGSGYFSRHTVTTTQIETPYFPYGSSMAGEFERISVSRGGNVEGLYDSSGNIMSGTCGSNTCNYYKLLQYYDENGNPNVSVQGKKYYYLVTRDTNIMSLTGTNTGSITVSKPVTITGIYNGTKNDAYINIGNVGGGGFFGGSSSGYILLNEDARIEHITILTNRTARNSIVSNGYSYATNSIIGNYNNLKVGRGIGVRNTNNNSNDYWIDGVYGGASLADTVSAGSSSDLFEHSLIVESGKYNNIYFTEGNGADGTLYMDGTCILGSDIDRANTNNDNLNVNFSFMGTAGSVVYRSKTNTSRIYNIYTKSGQYGTSKYGLFSGIYTGGRGGVVYGNRSLTLEGGYIYSLIGGLGVPEAQKDSNVFYINIKGGEADAVFGGSGSGTTYGNRIINMSGGTVNYSVFGGSNGSNLTAYSDDSGITLGDTFVYVGGKAKVGTKDDTLFGSESGSVFGAGAGANTKDGIGSVNNSHVMIDGEAVIKGNVYGGGNYGAVGSQSTSSTCLTTVDIKGGTISGSVYGGGNNNGSGKSDTTSTITINLNNGKVGKSVYGGSRTNGDVYGSVNVNISGGEVTSDVYGGGEGGYTSSSSKGTYVRDNVNVTVNSGTINGSVYGGSAYGTVNALTQNAATSTSGVNVTVNGGVIKKNVFGGAKGSSSYTPQVAGPINVTVNGGSIGKVFGGFDASGKPKTTDVVYLKGGTVGDAFGGGNNANQDTTDIRLQGSTITGNLYGGSNLLGTVTTSNVTVTSGSVVDIYGGNNMNGMTITTNVNVTGGTITGDIYGGGMQATSTTSNVSVNGITMSGSIYGGGQKAGLTTSNVTTNNITAKSVFGGSNVSGDVTTSNVHITNSNLTSVYGGNNQGGSTTTTNVDVNNSNSNTITNVFGGGDNASSETSYITINSGKITNVYGGGNEAGVNTTNLYINKGDITNVFGGSNKLGDVGTSNVNIGNSANLPVAVDIQYTKRAPGYYPQSNKPTYAQITVTVTNNTSSQVDDWEVELNVPKSEIFANNSNSDITVSGDIYKINSVNRYYGINSLSPNGGTYTFTFEVLSDTALNSFDVTGKVSKQPNVSPSSSPIQISNVFGGNNLGGLTSSANINAIMGNIGKVYGGGNEANVGTTKVEASNISANEIYGGGNAANVTGNTYLDIDSSSISSNVFGGGNEGAVNGNTEVFITDSSVGGNAYAGGNGSTAVVKKNSTITIDGDTIIGTSATEAPVAGCVFGSGNAANTGSDGSNSIARVNIVGGSIYGNVYGGAKMAVVYGVTDTNIGVDAVNNSNLVESDLYIKGTVFGGGESNASGSENYDYTFISVTEGIDVNINGNGYVDNNHTFTLNGSIFGSGNASSSSGDSNIYIKNLGTREHPNKNISIQRATNLTIDASVIELEGTTDRTNEYSDFKYSFNMIDKLIIKNNTVLLLQHNANMLKELYSGVDSNGSLRVATVDIDEDNKTVTKNVDNRIYMVPNQNLHITINQGATAYGKVTGMTFFGMYNSFDNGTYRYGLYDDDLDYGDSGNAGLEISGGSYVIGLHHNNHDITKDGFYTNYLNDDYTEVTTNYIDPSEIGETGYRWIVGFEAINYEFTLNASKYASLGTYELQLIDFARGDTEFNVLGFDASGLNTEVSLVDSTQVPRVGATQEIADSILGLSMKAETQEWMGYGTTKLLSASGGKITGDKNYKTDSRQTAPSLMFYLYHAKNMNTEGELGTVILTLQAVVPKNEIEYDIKFITITINLVARLYDDIDSYDASITYDKKYEMPSTTSVNITNQSQFSAYYAMIIWTNDFNSVYGRNNDNYHVLTTNHPLPKGTMITMLDYGANANRPEYYYFEVTDQVYNDSLTEFATYNEATYKLSNFIKMNSTSTNNTYDDSINNRLYFNESQGLVDEEFMFIFDLKETTTTGEHLDNTMLLEMRNNEDRTVYNVLGIREGLMKYNTYESSNVVLKQTFSDVDSYLYYDIPDEFNYVTRVQYNLTENLQSVIDTNYESSKMGLNVALFDKDGTPVSSSLLVGASITYDNKEYFADGDGIFRIKLANKVSNLNRNFKLTVDENLPIGQYTIRYTLFASDDGLHNSIFENSVTKEFIVNVVSSDDSIAVDCDDLVKIVDGDTGLNLAGNANNVYNVKYSSKLNNPNIRLEVLKRDVSSISTTLYNSIPFNNLFTNRMVAANGNEVYLDMDGTTEKSFDFHLANGLTSGTYRLNFKLYDNNQLIDNDVKYVIVSKKTDY